MENYLITWFYAEDKDDESYYPSVGGHTSTPEFQKVYWKCVFDFYRSAQLTQNPDSVRYLFFTNVPNIPTDVDGIPLADFFRETKIEVRRLDLTYRTPKDWYGSWRNQFYLFDILRCLSENYAGNFLILDSDVFITQNLLPVFQEIQKKRVLCYECGDDASGQINGISISQMKSLYTDFSSGMDPEGIRYRCGEIIAITSDVIPDMLRCFYDLWKYNYTLYEKKENKLNEEAHFLSLIYHHLGYDNIYANPYIKRMWTALRHDNIAKGDENLTIWHLPAEKKYLFDYMAGFLNQPVTREACIRELRAKSHIPGWKATRYTKRFIARVWEKMNKKEL